MPGFLFSLLIVFGMIAPGGTPADQSPACADLTTYLTVAGETIKSELGRLIADDEWTASFNDSIAKANEPGMGILALESDSLEPILDLVALPGVALSEIADEDVPPIARELHDSAVLYHQTMPEMLDATNRGGMYASLPFLDTLDEAGARNLEAQRTIRGTCPEAIAEIETFRAENDVIDLNNALTDPETLDAAVLDAMNPEAERALSFSMLFFMQDDQGDTTQSPDTPPNAPPPPTTPAEQPAGEKKSGQNGFARIGDPAPDFEMQTFDGETFRLSEHRGEVVIVNFWGSWCPPCREEMPAFQQAWEESDDDVVFVGVGSKRDSASEAQAFADEFGVTYPIGRDTEGGSKADGQITRDYNILVYPTTYIVDTDGNISAIVMYAMNMDDLAGYIDQARNP